MKLALTINGTPIETPSGISGLSGGLTQNGAGQRIITTAIQILLVVGITFALFSLLFAAIGWITSAGDKQKIQSARNRIIFSIVGLVVVLLSFFILSVIERLLGIPQPDTFPIFRNGQPQ